MLFKDIAIVNEDFELEEHKYVVTQGERIAVIADEQPEGDFGETYDGAGKLLMPAFYNTHSHLPMALMRGYAENLPLMEWLQGRIFPFEGKMTAEDMYWGTMLGIEEMLRFGIASSTEMYLNLGASLRAFADAGVKGNVCQSVSWFGDEGFRELPFYQQIIDDFKMGLELGGSRIVPELCAHSEYTTTEKVVKQIVETADELNAGIHVHVSETRSEVDLCRKRHQRRSPVKYLYDCGVFDRPTTAAHCVHVDDEDVAILKEKNVTVSSNPKSNAKLASGICPVTSLLRAGVNVAIGTDSVASNNNLSMIEEMRFFSLLQKGSDYDPTAITPKEALFAATRAGALSQRRDDCGLVKEGFRADLTVLNVDQPYMKPVHNLLNNVVYSAQGTDVVLTMVDGTVMYRDGAYPLLDRERIEYEVEARRQRILGELAQEVIPDLVEE